MSRVVHRNNELYRRQRRIENCLSKILTELSPLGVEFPLLDLTKRGRFPQRDSTAGGDLNQNEKILSPKFYHFQNREWSDVTHRLA